MSASLTQQTKSYVSKLACPSCGRHLEPNGKFCGECGTNSGVKTDRITQVKSTAVPNFASPGKSRISPNLINELHDLQFQIFRQRVFLGVHWGAFALLNLTGIGLAIKCYLGVCGDESTKIALALIPMFYINLCALVFLSYIKSTRTEMQTLRQKLSHVRFKIEYGSLL